MEKFEKKLRSLVKLDNELLEKFKNCFYETEYRKGNIFIKKGQFSPKIGFLNSGVLAEFCSNKNQKNFAMNFFTPSCFVGSFSSLITENTNRMEIVCLTDCEVLVGDYQKIKGLYAHYPEVEKLLKHLAYQMLLQQEQRVVELVTMKAKDRYDLLKDRHPTLEQQVPLYQIASYLGITGIQLSRIRSKRTP